MKVSEEIEALEVMAIQSRAVLIVRVSWRCS
jgi:ABC-type transporter Mla maintaining outer membrane lipid asymmetry permease subunit MlaE